MRMPFVLFKPTNIRISSATAGTAFATAATAGWLDETVEPTSRGHSGFSRFPGQELSVGGILFVDDGRDHDGLSVRYW